MAPQAPAATHTPDLMQGWTVGPDAMGGWPIYLPDGRHFCTVSRAPGIDAEKCARQIAAAPDLLAALKDCRNAMCADNPADGWLEIIQAADAAIAKAEGR